MTDQVFTNSSNARRAAKRLLATGAAPAVDFDIQPDADGRFAIHWHTPKAVEAEITAAAGQPAMTPDHALDSVCGAGTAADMPRLLAAPEPKAKRTRRAAKSDAPAAAKGPRAKFAGAPVEPGKLPAKPVLTAAGFTASYQKRIDHLAELAAAGDWEGVASYEIKGKNIYSKIVARYRDQLVAAHAAEQGAGQ